MIQPRLPPPSNSRLQAPRDRSHETLGDVSLIFSYDFELLLTFSSHARSAANRVIYLSAMNANEVTIVGVLIYHSRFHRRIGIVHDVLSVMATMVSKRETFTL